MLLSLWAPPPIVIVWISVALGATCTIIAMVLVVRRPTRISTVNTSTRTTKTGTGVLRTMAEGGGLTLDVHLETSTQTRQDGL